MGMLKLLFVEDEPDIRDVVTLALGLDVTINLTCFSSGVEALTALHDDPDPFRFALLNVRLPTMTGIELHQRLREMAGMAKLRSVLITAAPRDVTDEVRKMPGICGVIVKPFDPLTLASEVRSILRKP